MKPNALFGLSAVAVIAALLAASVAAAAECRSLNVSINFDEFQEIDPIGTFVFCGVFPVHGKVNGRDAQFLSCIREDDDFVASDDIFGDGDFRFFATTFFDAFETAGGDLTLNERGWIDFDTELQSSIFEVTGGSGEFQGASGLLTGAPKWPKKLNQFRIQGEICTPFSPGDDDDSDSDSD